MNKLLFKGKPYQILHINADLMDSLLTALFFVGILFITNILADYAYATLHPIQSEDRYLFENIAKQVASNHKFILNIFDCSDFSQELYLNLIAAGYDKVDIQTACNSILLNNTYSQCHAWVVLTLGNEDIYIESITGDIKSKTYFSNKFPYDFQITNSTHRWVTGELN